MAFSLGRPLSEESIRPTVDYAGQSLGGSGKEIFVPGFTKLKALIDLTLSSNLHLAMTMPAQKVKLKQQEGNKRRFVFGIANK
jgi:hypothetical protein